MLILAENSHPFLSVSMFSFRFQKPIFFRFRLELDKSSSDVAAEGAILNEMLEIVAKRAALRPSDTIPHSNAQMADGLESDVSECSLVCRSVSKISWIPVFIQFIVVYASILYFAFRI